MRVSVGDCRLFIDVEGLGLVPDGPTMRARPTMLVLHGEQLTWDHREDLATIESPALLLSGVDDPVTPRPCAELIAAALGPDRYQVEVFEDCGHGVWRDQPEAAFDAMRRFLV